MTTHAARLPDNQNAAHTAHAAAFAVIDRYYQPGSVAQLVFANIPGFPRLSLVAVHGLNLPDAPPTIPPRPDLAIDELYQHAHAYAAAEYGVRHQWPPDFAITRPVGLPPIPGGPLVYVATGPDGPLGVYTTQGAAKDHCDSERSALDTGPYDWRPTDHNGIDVQVNTHPDTDRTLSATGYTVEALPLLPAHGPQPPATAPPALTDPHPDDTDDADDTGEPQPLPAYPGPVSCPWCYVEQTHCTGCGDDMY